MKIVSIVLFLSVAASSLVFAGNHAFTLDFHRVFATQKTVAQELNFNLYEEGCDAAEFIVPAGTVIKGKALSGASCRVDGVRKLRNGAAAYRLRMSMETDSQESCRFLVSNAQAKRRAVVIFGCIGT